MGNINNKIIENVREYENAISEIEKESILKKLRGNIAIVINFDQDMSKGYVEESINYIIENGIKLKESYDGKKLISESKCKFTEDDFADAIYYLQNNFCDERLNDIKNISRGLYIKKNEESIEEVESKKKRIAIAVGIGLGIVILGIWWLLKKH